MKYISTMAQSICQAQIPGTWGSFARRSSTIDGNYLALISQKLVVHVLSNNTPFSSTSRLDQTSALTLVSCPSNRHSWVCGPLFEPCPCAYTFSFLNPQQETTQLLQGYEVAHATHLLQLQWQLSFQEVCGSDALLLGLYIPDLLFDKVLSTLQLQILT